MGFSQYPQSRLHSLLQKLIDAYFAIMNHKVFLKEDRPNGLLDTPLNEGWTRPICWCCPNQATLAVLPDNSYVMGWPDTGFPLFEDAIFYCYQHWPIKYRLKR